MRTCAAIVATIPLMTLSNACSEYQYDNLSDDGRVAFRIRLPSPVRYHNSTLGLERGNIVRWETSVSERRRGLPLHLEARFDRRSVFSVTLILLATAAVSVILAISASLYFLTRTGRRQLAEPQG